MTQYTRAFQSLVDTSWEAWEAQRLAAISGTAERQAERGQVRQALASLPAQAYVRAEAAHPPLPPSPSWRFEHGREIEAAAGLIVNCDLVRERVTSELAQLDKQAMTSRALEIAQAVAEVDPPAGYKMAVCNHPDFAELGICVHPDEYGVPALAIVKVRRQRCWLRVCPKCQRDIANRLRLRYERRIRIVSAECVPGWSLKSFVLTLDREIDDEGKELKRLGDLTKKLVKHFWGAPGAGAFATFEIGAAGGKLHAHGVSWGPYVPKAELSDYWKKISGCQVTWIRKITPSEAVREGIKYLAKLSQRDEENNFILSVEQLARLHMAMKGKRRLRAWGCFYGLADFEGEPVADADELEEQDKGERCDEGHKLIWAPVWLVRHLLPLDLKGAIKCSILEHPPIPLLPGKPGSGPPLLSKRVLGLS